MRIDYSVSLWNFYHYSGQPSLERVAQRVRDGGYGIEFWGSWGDEHGLYDETGRKRLAAMTDGMVVSLHTAGAGTQETMTAHIDTAAATGARTIVLHPGDVCMPDDPDKPNLEHTKWAVDYADSKGVKLALENGGYEFLCETIGAVDGLGFCLDVGHPYFEDRTIGDFLDALKDRLIHLHIQDTLSEPEKALPNAFGDHYILGTGGIPGEHWQDLARTLNEIDFDGIAVYEIHPRDPMQTAFLADRFMADLLGT